MITALIPRNWRPNEPSSNGDATRRKSTNGTAELARLTQHDKEFAVSDEEEDCGKEADQGVHLYDSELDEAEGQLDTLNDVASRDEGTDLNDSEATSSQEEDDKRESPTISGRRERTMR